MVIKNKRGWIRILEATISVLLVAGVLVFAFTRSSSITTITTSEQIEQIETEILENIAFNETWRDAILGSLDDTTLENELELFYASYPPPVFNFTMRVCDVATGDKITGYEPVVCKVETGVVPLVAEKDVFSKERIISSTLSQFGPRKVVIFMWER